MIPLILFFAYAMLLPLIPNKLNGQNITNRNAPDSLSKYSYLLTGYLNTYDPAKETNTEQTATGFFVRKNNKLLFLLARHTATKKDLNPPNTYAIWINKHLGGDSLRLLRLSKSLYPSDLKKYEEPDVYIHLFETVNDYPVNSIENFIEWKNIDYSRGDTGVIYSYYFPQFDPSRKVSRCDLRVKQNKSQNLRISNSIDSINYLCEMTSKGAGPGSSGAPIFIKRDGRWIFGGICISGSLVRKELYVVRPEIVIKLIEDKLNKLATRQ